MLSIFTTESELGTERVVSVSDLQVVDASEACVVEDTDYDLLVLLHSGQKFRVQHYEASVSYHGVDIMPVPYGIFDTKSSGDLIAHAGIAVLHVVGIQAACTPHPLHVSGK